MMWLTLLDPVFFCFAWPGTGQGPMVPDNSCSLVLQDPLLLEGKGCSPEDYTTVKQKRKRMVRRQKDQKWRWTACGQACGQ